MTAFEKSKVILNTLTPGFCYSELMRHAVFPLNVLGWVGKRLIGRSTEMGSRTLVAAASAGEESHGCYMTDCLVREPSRWVRSETGKETQQKVYKELLMILEDIQPGVTKNI
jgi:retinol dehydrogenase-12